MSADVSLTVKEIEQLRLAHRIGRVLQTDGSRILVSGISDVAHVGDLARVRRQSKPDLLGEVVQIDRDHISIVPEGSMEGLQLGSKVLCEPARSIAPDTSWLGQVLDANGKSLSGDQLRSGTVARVLHAKPPSASGRRSFGRRLRTGSAAMNTFLPLVQGQRVGLFAGSGVGKTSLLGTLVKNIDCDVAVVALIGERGREVRHFTESVLGPEGMANTIVVAATSDRSALERRRCAWTAMTIAEHFRDSGKSVLFVADSVTRFAEAHREIASGIGEVPVLRGHPPSTPQLIAELCERAGPGEAQQGDITAVLSVLVQGSDMEEPIADMLRGVLDGHIVLTRSIAERGRFPAIDLLRSVSRSLPDAAEKTENDIINKVRRYMSIYEDSIMMVKSGLYAEGTDPDLDAAVKIWKEVDEFMGQIGPLSPEQSFDKLRLILRRSGLQ